MSARRRLAKLTPGELDDAQRAVYDAVVGGPRAQGPQAFRLVDDDGCLEGPFNAMLLRPALGLALQGLGSAIRYGTTLSDRAREIAILAVAVHYESDFERYAHEAVGRHVGLTDDELASVGSRDHSVFSAPAEAVVARSTQLLLESGDLDDAAYAEAIATLGIEQVFELLTLVGYYSALALQLRVFRVPAPRT